MQLDLEDPPTLGSRLRRARLLKSLREPEDVTATEIAKALKVSSQSVGSWERDEKRPGDENLQRLAHFLGVRSAWLAWGEPPMLPTTNAAPRGTARMDGEEKVSGATSAARGKRRA